MENRCRWVKLSDPLYVKYHDEEWGQIIKDDRLLFERVCMEGMQAGLSWITVLKKREDFRAAFHHFDIDKVAEMDEEIVIPELLQNEKLIRSKNKLLSIIK
ncbi:MAG: DNA-3-methyladenine glycosylase I, partial [Negativicutes bacterium]|nr:DNA-3-methyladenine glycosylase I [Negativicutes bacterium]